MKQIKRKRKVLSVLTIVMFLVSTVWSSFAYADLIPYTEPVAQTIIQQDVTSEETPEVKSEEVQAILLDETNKDATEIMDLEVEKSVIKDETKEQDKDSDKCVPNLVTVITFEKIWKDENGETIAYEDTKDLPQVKVRIYDKNETYIQTLYLKNSEHWKASSEHLDFFKEYHFREAEITGLPEKYELDKDKSELIEGSCDDPDFEKTYCNKDNDKDKDKDKDKDDVVINCNYTVTNTIIKIPEIPKKDITVTKVWKDGETVIEDTSNFPEVKARIDFKDESVEDILLTLNKANGWKNGVENIDSELEYDITEEAVTGLQGYTLVGEPEIKEECVPVVSKTTLDQVQDDNNTKCLYTITNKVNKEVFNFKGTISGLKYNDLDKDGYHDPEEAAVAGFTIDLYDVNPELTQVQPIKTAVTNAYGVFSFEVANAGTYYLREALVNGWTQSAPANNVFMIELTAENNNFPESFIEDPAYQNVIQKYAKDETAQLFDVAFIFGNYENVDATSTVIEGHKFSDLNANGAWDESEPGLQGWTITLWKYMGDMDESGTLTVEDLQNIGTTVTDANGHYEFSDVQPGVTYYLSENITSQIYWTQMYPITGPELSGMGRMNEVVQISAGERVSGINFGNYYYRPSSRSSSGGSSTTTTTTNVIETFSAGDLNTEPEIRTLSMPVFSSGEDTSLEQTLKVNQGIEDSYADSQNTDVDSQTSDANPQTSDAGLTPQLQALGLSIAAMFALKRRLRR